MTISGLKAKLCCSQVDILGFRCDRSGCRPIPDNIREIVESPQPRTLTELRSFLGMVRVYGSFIKDLASIAEPLNKLTKVDAAFLWGEEEEEAFQKLKELLRSAPVLGTWEQSVDKIAYVTTDASALGVGAVVEIKTDEGMRPVQFFSKTLKACQSNYDAAKRELLGIKMALKKFSPFLRGRKVIVKTDSTCALAWIKKGDVDCAIMRRWIAAIKEFDVRIEHIRGESNAVADYLSRVTQVAPGEVWHTDRKGRRRLLVEDTAEQNRIVEEIHVGPYNGHRRQEATLEKVRRFYTWPLMHETVRKVLGRCKECQLFDPNSQKEKIMATEPTGVWRKVHVDLVEMPCGVGGYRYFVDARDDLSGFVVAEPLKSKSSVGVAKFLRRLFARFGPCDVVVADRGELNSEVVKSKMLQWGIRLALTTAYHPQSNGPVERGHRDLVKAMEKWTIGRKGLWPEHLDLACLADNITVKGTTGHSPFFLMFGHEPDLNLVFPAEEREEVSREILLERRVRALINLDEHVSESIRKVTNSREYQATYASPKRFYRREPLTKGDLVLRTAELGIKLPKFTPRWFGPFRIEENLGNGAYRIAELDGSVLTVPVHGNRLKAIPEWKSERVSGGKRSLQSGEDIEGPPSSMPRLRTCEVLASI